MPIEIRRFDEMPSSRSSRYCLSIQNDSVFADFDVDNEGCVFLIRISFDGYGCCDTTGKARIMSPDRSRKLVDLIEADDVVSGELAVILSQYFRENSDVIWKDALEEHDLLCD